MSRDISSEARSDAPVRVLVVDDEPLVRLNTRVLLQQSGYVVEEAPTGEAAISAIESGMEVDAVLMDLDFGPGRMDGVAAAAAIREQRDLPVVFFSAHTTRDRIPRARDNRAYGYVMKAQGHEHYLVETLDMAVRLHQAERASAAAEARLAHQINRLNHRIRNALSILSSLIRIRVRRDGRGSCLLDVLGQLSAVAVLHGSIEYREDGETVDLGSFLPELCGHLGGHEQGEEIACSAEPTRIDARNAMPMALIVVEAIANARRHGTTADGSGVSIWIRGTCEPGTYRVTIVNSGGEIPPAVQPDRERALGLWLIQSMAEQMGGTFQLLRQDRPGVAVEIPLAGARELGHTEQ